MPIEFKAEKDADGNLIVKAVVERVGNDVTIHIPSFVLIQKLKNDLKEKEDKK